MHFEEGVKCISIKVSTQINLQSLGIFTWVEMVCYKFMNVKGQFYLVIGSAVGQNGFHRLMFM